MQPICWHPLHCCCLIETRTKGGCRLSSLISDRRRRRWRLPPFGVRAKVSATEGRTWSDWIVLREDAGTGDIGYVSPRVHVLCLLTASAGR